MKKLFGNYFIHFSMFLNIPNFCNFGCVKSMTLLVNFSSFLLPIFFCFRAFATYFINSYKVFTELPLAQFHVI